MAAPCSRSRLPQRRCEVEIHTACASPAGSIARRRKAISSAALRVKVMAAMAFGSVRPLRTRCAMRAQMTRVFPDPGLAITRIGPSEAVTASRWRSLRLASRRWWSSRAGWRTAAGIGIRDRTWRGPATGSGRSRVGRVVVRYIVRDGALRLRSIASATGTARLKQPSSRLPKAGALACRGCPGAATGRRGSPCRCARR